MTDFPDETSPIVLTSTETKCKRYKEKERQARNNEIIIISTDYCGLMAETSALTRVC